MSKSPVLFSRKELNMKTKFLLTGFVALVLVATLGWNSSRAMELSPTARGYHQMTYDSESGLVVLYGGQTGYWLDPAQQSQETWTFDPDTSVWTQMFPAVS